MPCIICEESAHDNGSHGYVVAATQDEDGTTWYTCFKCATEMLRNE